MNRTPLPGQDVQDKLDNAIELASKLVVVLRHLNTHEAWKEWNKDGRPRQKMPGYYTSPELLALSRHMKGRLVSIKDSFEFRKKMDLERHHREELYEKIDANTGEQETHDRLEDIREYAKRMLNDDDVTVRQYGENLLTMVKEENGAS